MANNGRTRELAVRVAAGERSGRWQNTGGEQAAMNFKPRRNGWEGWPDVQSRFAEKRPFARPFRMEFPLRVAVGDIVATK